MAKKDDNSLLDQYLEGLEEGSDSDLFGFDDSGGMDTLATSWLEEFVDLIDPDKDKDDSMWYPQEGPQNIAFFSEADETFFGGSAGGGKMQSTSSIVYTPSGFEKIGNLKVGDKICIPNGKFAYVTHVIPQGKKDLYEFVFSDGAKTLAGMEHLWLVRRNYSGSKWFVKSTKDILDVGLFKKKVTRGAEYKSPVWVIPVANPVYFEEQALLIDPYVLGVLLGDGSFRKSHGGIELSCKDGIIAGYCQDLLRDRDHVFKRVSEYKFRLVNTVKTRKNNRYIFKLRELGLWDCLHNEKFIPKEFLFNSIDNRLELLRGILDADGHAHFRYNRVIIESTSNKLLEGVQWLIRSLGGTATLNTQNRKTSSGNTVYKVYGNLPEDIVPFKHPSKVARWDENSKRISPPKRTIQSIDLVSNDEAVCIMIDHPDHLYITDDFIVTHNTDLMLGLALSLASPHQKAIIFRRSYPELKDIITRGLEILSGSGARFVAGNAMRFDGLPGGKSLELGSVPNFTAATKYRGRPHDLKLFDEVADFCLVPDTEVLTVDGWKQIVDIQVGEKVLSVDQDNIATYKQVTNAYQMDYDGPMYHTKTRSIEYVASPNHKMPLRRQLNNKWRFESMKTLPEGCYYPFSYEYEGEERDVVAIPTVSGRGIGSNSHQVKQVKTDTLVQFLGWYLAEGHCMEGGGRSGPIIRIPQSREDMIAKLDKLLLGDTPFKFTKQNNGYDKDGKYRGYTYYSCNRQLYEYLKPFGKSYDKYIPSWIFSLSQRQMQLFLDAFVDGDGHYVVKNGKRTGGITITLASKRLVADLQRLCVLLGRKCTINNYLNSYWGDKRFDTLYIYNDTVKSSRASTKQHTRIIDYNGVIACIEVEDNHTFLARYNGKVFWSGNSESAYTFLIGWARSTTPGVPVRVVAAGNPPTNNDGAWVTRRWGAWIDPNHPNPADPGELRWFATLDGDDVEITPDIDPDGCDGGEFEYTDREGRTEMVQPKSRTFIPARLGDNEYLARTDYRAVLQNMPEPFRSQLLYGDFNMSFKEDPYQVIPTSWVRAAEKRWEEAKEAGIIDASARVNPAFGLDVSEAGADKTVLALLTGTYLQYFRYIEVKDDDIITQAHEVEKLMAGVKLAPIGVDAIGIGSGLASYLRHRGHRVAPIKVSRATKRKDKHGIFSFLNVRAEMWWRMREALDPSNENAISLPPSIALRTELTGVKYERTPNDKLKIEPKAAIKERLGKSPDIAEAVILALYVQARGSVALRMA